MTLLQVIQRRVSSAKSVRAASSAQGGRLAHAYNESAFRYFLALDRRRAQRAARPLLLVLVTVRMNRGRAATLKDATASTLLVGLRDCFREVDLVGWYKQRRVAAALLEQGVTCSIAVRRVIADRVLASLRQRLPPDRAAGLRVRVVPLGNPLGRESV